MPHNDLRANQFDSQGFCIAATLPDLHRHGNRLRGWLRRWRCSTMYLAGPKEQWMDIQKALSATEARRELLHKYPFEHLPNLAARQDAEGQMMTIWEDGPKSCEEVLPSLGGWLDILFVAETHKKYLRPHLPDTVRRVRETQRKVISDLSRIDAELNKWGLSAAGSAAAGKS